MTPPRKPSLQIGLRNLLLALALVGLGWSLDRSSLLKENRHAWERVGQLEQALIRRRIAETTVEVFKELKTKMEEERKPANDPL